MFLEKCSLWTEVTRWSRGQSESLCAGETHHILVIIPLLSGNPSVRVAVPDSELHGAAKGACSWRRQQVSLGQWAAQALGVHQ